MLSPPPTYALALTSLVIACVGGSHARDSSSTAFASAFPTHPSNRLHRPSSSSSRQLSHLHMAPPSQTKATVAEIEAESEQLRKEIDELRAEALRRLEDLNEKLTGSSSLTIEPATATVSTASGGDDEGLLPAPTPITFTGSKSESSSGKKKSKGIGNLLDETRWKVTLSIGREPGTWMPKDWGKSGQRINVSFIAEFTTSQLYDRDDFLRGGYTDAKILHVVDNEIKLGPSVSEGQRTYKVKDGGWQVTRGDGPMGTDLLRFFVEVDDQVEHTGGDVHVPRGRVYSSCGYFPFLGNAGGDAPSVKEAFTKELRRLEEQAAELQKKRDEIKNPFNLDGIKISREIFRLNRQAEEVNNKLNFAMVQEPDKSLLRFSKDGDVGLTREGGVCCQVNKGPVVEYHILGRFSIASAEHD